MEGQPRTERQAAPPETPRVFELPDIHGESGDRKEVSRIKSILNLKADDAITRRHTELMEELRALQGNQKNIEDGFRRKYGKNPDEVRFGAWWKNIFAKRDPLYVTWVKNHAREMALEEARDMLPGIQTLLTRVGEKQVQEAELHHEAENREKRLAEDTSFRRVSEITPEEKQREKETDALRAGLERLKTGLEAEEEREEEKFFAGGDRLNREAEERDHLIEYSQELHDTVASLSQQPRTPQVQKNLEGAYNRIQKTERRLRHLAGDFSKDIPAPRLKTAMADWIVGEGEEEVPRPQSVRGRLKQMWSNWSRWFQ